MTLGHIRIRLNARTISQLLRSIYKQPSRTSFASFHSTVWKLTVDFPVTIAFPWNQVRGLARRSEYECLD